MLFMISIKNTINICSSKGLKYSWINSRAKLESINTRFLKGKVTNTENRPHEAIVLKINLKLFSYR